VPLREQWRAEHMLRLPSGSALWFCWGSTPFIPQRLYSRDSCLFLSLLRSLAHPTNLYPLTACSSLGWNASITLYHLLLLQNKLHLSSFWYLTAWLMYFFPQIYSFRTIDLNFNHVYYHVTQSKRKLHTYFPTAWVELIAIVFSAR